MKVKIITLLIATIIYTAISVLIYFFVDNTYSLKQIILMSIFFGISMGIFEALVRPVIFKTLKKKSKSK